MTWQELQMQSNIYLYAGGFPKAKARLQRVLSVAPFVALSLHTADQNIIQHDITQPMPLPDNSVDIYQAEDVFEHIEPDVMPRVLAEIHRVLKPKAWLRFSVPDYGRADIDRFCFRDCQGRIIFDASQGGKFDRRRHRVVRPCRHAWFPTITSVRSMLANQPFTDVQYLHYTDTDGTDVLHDIDYSRGYVHRTPDHDPRTSGSVMSIVVDCVK